MRYNVGDRVVKEEDLKFLFNPFWKEKYRKSLINTVTEANEKEFTIYNDKGRYDSTLENGHSCGMCNYLIFFQSSGRQYSYPCPTRLLHIEKDKEEIIKIIDEVGVKYFNEFNEVYEKQLSYYKKQQKELKEIYEKDFKINLELIEG